MKRKFLLILLVSILTTYCYGQSDNFWTVNTAGRVSQNTDQDQRYYELNLQGLKNVALQARGKRSNARTSNVIISFPTSDGQIKKFYVIEASVLPDELSAKYPGIYSFAGTAVDDPTTTIRFSLSDYNGVQGIILDSDQTTFIEVIEKGNLKNYKVYTDPEGTFKFKCSTSELGKKAESKAISPNDHSLAKATGPNLKTYRTAILTFPYYSEFYAGTGSDQQRRANVLAQVNSTLTQINAVFERDLSVRLQLVANNDQLVIFGDTPPFPGAKTTQDVIDGIIGFANYDIGHTLDKLGDPEHGEYEGNAGCIACICTETKGIAWTVGYNTSSSEFSLIVAHEFGHAGAITKVLQNA